MIETGLCAHSRPTADICATMMPQLGVSLDLIGRCQNLVMAGVAQSPFHTASSRRSPAHKASIHAGGGELQGRLRSDPPSSSESAFASLDDPVTAR